MTADEISSYAVKNEMPDQGMNYIDWLLWYMLRDIYAEFRQGTLDKEQGAARKKHSIEIWERETAKDERSRQIALRAAGMWRKVEEATSNYRKSRTVQNADLILVAMYGAVDDRRTDNAGQTERSSQEGGDNIAV